MLQWLFGKRERGTSLFEVPIKAVHDRLPQNRNHGAFKLLKEKNPSIPDEHIDVLIGFAYAAKREGINDIAEFLLATCQQYKRGQFFIKKSRGKYCLCIRQG